MEMIKSKDELVMVHGFDGAMTFQSWKSHRLAEEIANHDAASLGP
jgi:hypothetical protein